jgi:hypothetical protein
MAKRLSVAVAAAAATAAAWPANAQDWSVQSGAAARIEYNDNYFFTSPGAQTMIDGLLTPVATQSAFTGSITPFVTAARRTETSDVTALVAIGANKVWGISPTVDYVSGNFGLNGSLREARSTWTGNASFVRSASLQTETGPTGTALVLAFTNAATVGGTYTYALTERWSLGATVGAYSNTYSGVASGTSLSNNHGYSAAGNAGYAYSDRTQLTFSAGYSNYVSDVTYSDAALATIGVVHQFTPQLTVSASAGGFWNNSNVVQNDLPATGRRQRDTGELYGGSVSYAFSERTQFGANLAENLAPSSSGTLNRTDSAGLSLTHQFSERLTGRLGASYSRTTVPVTISSSSTDNYYSGEVGVSYLLAERWKLDAGYRYTGARYGQISGQPDTGQPRSNVVFISIGYNWPGASFTDWVGQRPNVQGLPGAGALSLPERLPGSTAPGPSDGPLSPTSPFDPFTIP